MSIVQRCLLQRVPYKNVTSVMSACSFWVKLNCGMLLVHSVAKIRFVYCSMGYGEQVQ